jgi:hypothetical protein
LLLSGRNGSRAQLPPRPDDIAWHCSMVSKLQLRIAEETSVRQYSYALAAVGVIAAKASANSAAEGAAVLFKNCFISFSFSL